MERQSKQLQCTTLIILSTTDMNDSLFKEWDSTLPLNILRSARIL